MILVYLLIALLGAAVAFFTLQNPEPIVINFFHWRSGKIAMSLLMLCSALAGVLLATLASFVQQLGLYRRIHYLERRLSESRRFADAAEPLVHSRTRFEETAGRVQEQI